MLVLLTLILSPLVLAQAINKEQATLVENPLIHGPQLVFNHPEPSKRFALPVDIEANVEVNGLVALVELKQVFINPHTIALDGKYQFPLPDKAAVKYLSIKVGDKEIIGQIMEMQAAKAVYKKAKQQGRKASLVEQQRPNLFTNKIANIPAQSRVMVSLKFIVPVTFTDDALNLNLPLAMTERYVPTQYTQSPAYLSSQLIPVPTKVIAESQARITVNLNAGVAVKSINSVSHKIKVDSRDDKGTSFKIKLKNGQALADRRFDLTWQLEAKQQTKISSFTEQVDGEHFTLLTVFPPQQEILGSEKLIARDIIFIIDTSGSMQGRSMVQAKASLLQAISQLRVQDSFNIIAFDNSVEQLFSTTKMATQQHVSRAESFINNLNANGGTEMFRPLSQALVMQKSDNQTSQALRQLIFITDGAVANEFELMQLLDDAGGNFRLYTVGIGAAPNGYFMKKAAQLGRGSYVFIQRTSEVQSKVATLMNKISQPIVSNIELIFDSNVHKNLAIYPKKIPDLFVGEPLQIVIKSELPITSILLNGKTAANTWQQQLVVDDEHSSHGVSTLWARKKIADLLDSLVTGADKNIVKERVIVTSISHQVMSPYTSFIAVEKQAADNKKQLKDTVIQEKGLLTVAMPQTALNWQQQFLIGLLLLILAIFTRQNLVKCNE